MKKLLLIAALILLTTQFATAQEGPISLPSPDEPQQMDAGHTFEEEVLEIVNQERWANGQLPPLKGNGLLNNAAETHSNNMAVRNFFAHCDLDTKESPWVRMQNAGYNYNNAGENIAAGQNTPTDVMNSWMNSSGHRANILSTDFREIGIGYVLQNNDQSNIRRDLNGDCNTDSVNNGPYYQYWTQKFGRRSSVYPVVINREAYETETRQVNLYMYGEDWATQMRFRNENGSWSSWETYQTDKSWTLSAGNGTKTVNAEIRNGSGTVRSANDTIMLNGTGPALAISTNDIAFALQHDGSMTQTRQFIIQNTGQEPFNWTLTENTSWLTVSESSGTISAEGSKTINVTVSRSGLSPATRNATMNIDAGSADNSPQTIDITFLLTDMLPVFLPMVTR